MKFQNSAIAATSLSGKSGGTTATITNIFRRKSNPRQPNTSKQSAVKARLTALATGWPGLTEAQQDAWIAAAPNFVYYRNGESYTIKGNTLYQKVNNNLIRAGNAAVLLPPSPAAFPNVTLATLTAEEDEAVLSLTFVGATTTPAGFSVMIVGTPCFSPGKRSVKNKLRELGEATIASSAANVLSIWEAYPGFGTLIEGQRIEIGFYLINNTTGQASKPQTLQVEVAAGTP